MFFGKIFDKYLFFRAFWAAFCAFLADSIVLVGWNQKLLTEETPFRIAAALVPVFILFVAVLHKEDKILELIGKRIQKIFKRQK